MTRCCQWSLIPSSLEYEFFVTFEGDQVTEGSVFGLCVPTDTVVLEIGTPKEMRFFFVGKWCFWKKEKDEDEEWKEAKEERRRERKTNKWTIN